MNADTSQNDSIDVSRIGLGDVIINFERNVIETGDGEVRLEPKVSRLLAALCLSSGKVLARDDLIRSIWDNAAGADQSLTNAISQIRKVLREHVSETVAIETVPKRGYRFVGEVTLLPPQPYKPILSSTAHARPLRLLMAFAVLTVTVIAIWLLPRPSVEAQGRHAAESSLPVTSPKSWQTGGQIIVVADLNIANAIDGDSVAPATPGNAQFFANILRGGRHVAIQDTDNADSVFIVAGPSSLRAFYESLEGVVTRQLSSEDELAAGILETQGLFISFLPSNPFTSAEIDVFTDHLANDGTILFPGDSRDYASNNSYINQAMVALGTDLLIDERKLDLDFRYAAGDQISDHPLTEGIERFTYATVSSVQGGAPLFKTIYGDPFAAVSTVPPQSPGNSLTE